VHSPFIQESEDKIQAILPAIEDRGLRVDLSRMREVIAELRERRESAAATAYDLLKLPRQVNLNSSAEVAQLLADLRVSGWELTSRRAGRVSAAREVLERIDHPAIPYVIEYRSLTKLISALESYHDGVDLFTDRLYYRFTNHCSSGRLYTRDMSVQNLPHEGRVAVVSDPVKVFISAEYDSFELKILSALSGDRCFRQCWRDGIDLHRKVVSDMRGIPYDQVTDSDRLLGKALNFGVVYGQEPADLARKLNIPVPEARKLISEYSENIPEVVTFKQECVQKARECGYAETHFGRRRYLPDLSSDARSVRAKAERQLLVESEENRGTKLTIVLPTNSYKLDKTPHEEAYAGGCSHEKSKNSSLCGR
jgi:DNA polymerase-1